MQSLQKLRSLKKQQKGFTIVELLIVIVVIGILATLVIVTFSGIQQKARNTKRQTDINAIDSTVEAYYASNGFYPTLANLNDATFRTANLKGFDPAALQDPKGSTQTLAAATTATSYGYVATPASCDNTTTQCTAFVVTATLEGGGTYAKQSN
jgi:prepilin-type N-terminal cleavage/methylation domain-containing protein